jgi:hypothetical protein
MSPCLVGHGACRRTEEVFARRGETTDRPGRAIGMRRDARDSHLSTFKAYNRRRVPTSKIFRSGEKSIKTSQ